MDLILRAQINVQYIARTLAENSKNEEVLLLSISHLRLYFKKKLNKKKKEWKKKRNANNTENERLNERKETFQRYSLESFFFKCFFFQRTHYSFKKITKCNNVALKSSVIIETKAVIDGPFILPS